MRKIRKLRLLLAPLILFLILGSGLVAKAEDSNTFYSPEFGAKVKAFKVTETGETVELTPEEYNDLDLNFETEDEEEDITPGHSIFEENDKSGSLITPMDSFRSWYEFVPTTSTNYTGDPLKITADIGCTPAKGCTIGYGETYTKTIAVTYGNATNTDKEIIKTSLGITYSSATAKTSSFSYHLKQGDVGYIAFKPYKVKKEGYFKLCNNESKTCSKTTKTGYARIPKKTANGQADGIFYFVFK